MQKNYYFFSLILFSFLSVQGFAQNILTGKEAIKLMANAELIRTSKFGNVPSFIKYREGQQPNSANFLSNIARNLKLDSHLQLVLDSQQEDRLGFVHYRFHQEYDGIPVEYTAWYVHSKNGRVISANGFIHRTLPNAKTKVITAEQSIQFATNHIEATTYKWQLPNEEAYLKVEQNNPEATYYPQPKLVYVPKGNDYSSDLYQIAYKMDIYAQTPLSRQIVYVDAISGEILQTIDQIHVADVQGTATTGYSGTKTITADQVSSTNFRLRETGRGNGVETYNMQQGNSYSNATDFTDNDNNWNNVNAQFDEYATDAHWGAEMTYDYYLTEHNRNSIDNMGFKLRSYIHYNVAYNNAFWDGARMTYGDGNSSPLTSIDIAGHEISHGLTSYTASLNYSSESGALNESFSDIFGTAIERYGRPNNWDWLIGEDLGTAIRSMSNPNSKGDPDTYFGNNWASLSGGDNGGVHTNSSVQNYWFYLLSDGGTGTNDNGDTYNLTGIGFSDAEDVAYRNLTVYLSPTSDFAEARFYAIQSAIDLYGACTSKVGQVTDAWYAVGVGSAYVPYTLANFDAPTTTSCAAPFTVNFNNLTVNGTSYTWNFGDGSTSTQLNPSHTYTSNGNYTVTLNANGGTCGTDDTVKTNYVNIDPNLPCILSMPNNGTGSTQSSCSGFLYDSGGPTGNYGAQENSQITIAPSGATSINIYVHNFSVEAGPNSTCNYDDLKIYDGPNATSANLIGTYCNNNILTNFTSNTGVITITFSSDGGVEESGFELEWVCNSESTPPVARFSYILENTCTGDVSFTDESNNTPTSWNWNFGDGQTSTLQNPTHHYNASGTYTVELIATNAFGSGNKILTNIIQVNLETPPTTLNDTTCTGSSDTLIAFSSGNHLWYDSAYTGTSIFSGDTFITPPINLSTTYYVEQEVNSVPDSVGPVDNTFGGGNNFSGDQSMIFTVNSPMILSSVYVYAGSAGVRNFMLYDNANNLLQSKSVTLSIGAQVVNLDFFIQPGTGYQLGFPSGSSPDLFRNNSGVSYPYSNSLMSITSSSAGSNFYYFFYNWQVKTPTCKSPRVAVEAVVETCTGINEAINNVGINIYPNPAKTNVTIQVLNLQNIENATISFINSIGQTISTRPIKTEISTIDVSNLAIGIYYIRINTGDFVKTEKLIIQ